MAEEPNRLEDLPEPLIHQILGLLPTIDSTKFSILSKELRSTWLSFPVLDFNFADFSSKAGESNTTSESFFDFIKKSIEARGPIVKSKSCLKKIRLCHNSMSRLTDQLAIDGGIAVLGSLVNLAIQSNVEDLALIIGNEPSAEFLNGNHCLDPGLFALNSIKVLKLEGFIFGFENLNLTCPLLEFFSVDTCKFLKSIIITSSCARLREAIFRGCLRPEKIQVQAENLESFSYSGITEVHLVGDNIPHLNVNLPPWVQDFSPRLDFHHVIKFPLQCEIDISACKLLRKLYLENTLISDELYGQVDGLELLDFLHLVRCRTAINLEIHNPELRTLIMQGCPRAQSLVILSTELESFIFHSFHRNPCDIDVLARDCFTSLELVGASITDNWVKNTISVLYCIEKLVLDRCHLLEEIEFDNDSLSTFELKDCIRLRRAKIGARNLIQLSYAGNTVNCSLLIISTKCHAKISWRGGSISVSGEARTFLASFDHCKSLTLALPSALSLIFPKERISDPRFSPFHDLRYVIVELKEWPYASYWVELMESLLWLVPRPETMTFVSGYKRGTLQFQSSQQPTRKDVKNCCHEHSIKCWRHNVGKVVVENFEEIDRPSLKEFFDANI